jgi:hypothetical protein
MPLPRRRAGPDGDRGSTQGCGYDRPATPYRRTAAPASTPALHPLVRLRRGQPADPGRDWASLATKATRCPDAMSARYGTTTAHSNRSRNGLNSRRQTTDQPGNDCKVQLRLRISKKESRHKCQDSACVTRIRLGPITKGLRVLCCTTGYTCFGAAPNSWQCVAGEEQTVPSPPSACREALIGGTRRRGSGCQME